MICLPNRKALYHSILIYREVSLRLYCSSFIKIFHTIEGCKFIGPSNRAQRLTWLFLNYDLCHSLFPLSESKNMKFYNSSCKNSIFRRYLYFLWNVILQTTLCLIPLVCSIKKEKLYIICRIYILNYKYLQKAWCYLFVCCSDLHI